MRLPCYSALAAILLTVSALVFAGCDTTGSEPQPDVLSDVEALLASAEVTEASPTDPPEAASSAQASSSGSVAAASTIPPGRSLYYRARGSVWGQYPYLRFNMSARVGGEDLLIFVITTDRSGNVRRVLRYANNTAARGGTEETYLDPVELTSADYHAGFLFVVRSGNGGILHRTLTATPLPSQSAGFLSFPLRGDTPYTAPISAVLDHSLPQGNCADGRVVAYTGEEGRREWGESSWSTNNGCGTLRGYENRNGTSFSIGGQYNGGRYLYYDGHTGHDFPRPNGTSVYAAASGVAYFYDYGSERNVRIDHGNGYETYYLHLSSRSISNGQTVTTSTKIGDVGAGHLHLTVMKNGRRVDPYGWKGARGADPLPVDGGDNVCLWTECR